MPTYEYNCKKCFHRFDRVISMAQRMMPTCAPCPNCSERHVAKSVTMPLGLVDPIRMGRQKVSSGFNDVLQGIKNAHPGSTIKMR
jgi:putative FmdB family regulatory protein